MQILNLNVIVLNKMRSRKLPQLFTRLRFRLPKRVKAESRNFLLLPVEFMYINPEI